MNYDFNDINKYLREGGSPEDIAKAFADSLNEAIEINSRTEKLNEKASKVCNDWQEYADLYFITHRVPSGFVVSDFYLKREELEKIMDALVEMAPWIREAMDGVETVKKCNCEKTPDKDQSFEKTMESFLHDLGL